MSKKHFSTSKKILIVFAVILIAFAAINGVWYFGYKSTYNQLSQKLDKQIDEIDGTTIHYNKVVDEYIFSLKMPSYLGEGGFLSVGNKEGIVTEMDSKNNVIGSNGLYVSLYIWPQYWGKYKMGVDFYDEAAEIWEQVYIDSDLNIISAETLESKQVEYLQSLISENQEEIQNLIEAAENLWDIEL